MKKKLIWLLVSSITVLVLLAASCAPAPKEVAPAPKAAAPAVKEAAPAVPEKPAPAAGPEMVKVSFKKLDGTLVEKLIEKPRYGGLLKSVGGTILAWDEAIQAPWTTGGYLALTNEELIQGDRTRGKQGTGEVAWYFGGWMRASVMVGALAESWEIPDDQTAVFKIRKGVRWHDKPPVNGREFTADDVVYNIKRIYFDLPTATMYGMAGVSRPTDVYATDKYTVVLKSPKGQLGKTWEYIADWTRYFPREVIEKYGSHNDWRYVTGTGPFVLSDYVAMSATSWVRNPNYWMKDSFIPENQLPYLDGVKQICISDVSTQYSALRTGKIDVVGVSWEQVPSLQKTNPELRWMDYPQNWYNLYGMRVDKPELPFKDIRVRRALHMGINSTAMLSYFGGKGEILVHKLMPLEMFQHIYTPVGKLPPAKDGFDSNKCYGYYPEEAKKLLAEAGYPNGFKTEVVTMAGNVDVLSMVADYWSKIGVELKIDVKEYGVYMSIYQQKTHKEGLICGRWGDQPYDLFTLRKGNMYNWGMVDDPKMEDYYNKLTALYFDEEKRDQIMKEANLYIIEQNNYWCPPVGYMYVAWWPWLKGYEGEGTFGVASYYWQKYAWLDQDLKKQMGY